MTLTKILESKQETVRTDSNILPFKATVIDGGIMLHETVLKHSKSTYAMMARDLLVKICESCLVSLEGNTITMGKRKRHFRDGIAKNMM